MIISIASGKGGTGKTTIATNLAVILAEKNVWLLDCDVEAPNSHIFVKPDMSEPETIHIKVPKVDSDKCTLCGRCAEVCEYHAISVFGQSVLVFPELCHACGGCSIVCPETAVSEIDHPVGAMQRGGANGLKFVAATLNIGDAKATPVISAVKDNISHDAITIIDAPPGTSCPVVETVRGSDYVLLVTEPTPFGLNDLVLAVEVMRKLHLRFGVILNRSDIGDDSVDKYCQKENIEILMRIPQRREIAEAYSNGTLLIDALPEFRELFRQLYDDVEARL